MHAGDVNEGTVADLINVRKRFYGFLVVVHNFVEMIQWLCVDFLKKSVSQE